MNTCENILMTKNRVLQLANELFERGEFKNSTKSELDEFLMGDIIDELAQDVEQEGEQEGELEECIIEMFFDYQRTQIKNRLIKLARDLYESGEFDKASASKLDEFLLDYTIDQMVEAIQKETHDLTGDYIISKFFEYRRMQVKNRVIKFFAEFCDMGGFNKIATEYNFTFSKDKLHQFISENLQNIIGSIMIEKDSLFEGENGNKLLQDYLISLFVENTICK